MLDGHTTATANDLFTEICTTALDPPFCLEVIRSIPEAARALRLESLAQILVDFGGSNGTEILGYVRSLVQATKSPRLKSDYV